MFLFCSAFELIMLHLILSPTIILYPRSLQLLFVESKVHCPRSGIWYVRRIQACTRYELSYPCKIHSWSVRSIREGKERLNEKAHLQIIEGHVITRINYNFNKSLEAKCLDYVLRYCRLNHQEVDVVHGQSDSSFTLPSMRG